MKARIFDAERLDVDAFAAQGATLQGQWPLASMERVLDSLHPQWQGLSAATVVWDARGELRRPRAAQPQVWLRLNVQTRLPLVCQRCLGAVDMPMRIEKALRFVPGEDAAAEMDADSDDDVLASTSSLDLRSLIEDELLLALPLVPRHKECPPGAPAQREADTDDAKGDKPNPFAVLSALKRGTSEPS
jgi:uncharacterized protein